ncbi:MAG: hypothetical protein ACRER5_00405, partial [Pseudomonas sp.]
MICVSLVFLSTVACRKDIETPRICLHPGPFGREMKNAALYVEADAFESEEVPRAAAQARRVDVKPSTVQC